MIFKQLNPYYCKTYLIRNGQDNTAILVDPVIDHFRDYLDLLQSEKLQLTHVIDTHTHADHISACSALRDATDCEYIMHENAPAKCVSKRIRDGDVLALNGLKFTVMYTPGHTKDAVSLIVEDKLLTGDCLFLDDGGGGRDDLPGGDPAEHWESLRRIRELPDELMVYPAHDYRKREPSTLGNQRKTNPHLRNWTKEEFVTYLEDLRLGPAEWMKDVLKVNYACAMDPKAAWIPADIAACEIQGTKEKGVNETEVKYINAAELDHLLQADGAKPVLIDVREVQELTGPLGHIAGVLKIPIGSLASKVKDLEIYRDKQIIVICRSGARATTGAQILVKAGFTRVSVLEGGMLAWRKYKPAQLTR